MVEMHLWTEDPQNEGEQVTAAATLEHADGRKDTLWFRLPAEHSEWMTSRADPFVIGVIFPLMENARRADAPVRLVVHGAVSPSLIRSLEEFQLAWAMWRPDLYGRGTIRGEVENETKGGPPDESTVMCFSGGVDSSFTAYMHSTSGMMRFPRPLDAGVMVQGWEYGLEEEPLFLRAEERSRRIIGSLGLPLIRITTNFRQIVSRWSYSHGAAVASSLSLLQRRFQSALVAQTMTYRNNHLSLEGVNPITDWLLSSDSFRFIPDGAGYSRLEKIETISKWPEFLENVRVCWQDEEEKSENCCACEKCIRTILQFRVLGLGLPPAFPCDVSDRQIEVVPMSAETLEKTYQVILGEARNRSINAPWVRSLERRAKRTRNYANIEARPRWRKLHFRAWRKMRLLLNRA